MTDYELMGAALEEAARAAALGEAPVGAAVARNGEIIAASEGCAAKERCDNGIASERENAPVADMVEE